jgi:outer membrane protein TolC
MAKKEIRYNLTAAEYWEWRQTISDIEIAKLKLANQTSQLKLMQKEVDLLQARILIFQKTSVKDAEIKVDETKKEYERYKLDLETKLNLSLNNKLIDDVTFEVKDLPAQQTTKE